MRAPLLTRCSRAVADASEPGALRAIPATRIIGFIADAAQRWCDADFAPRVRATAAIEARLGYTTPVVDYALDRLFSGITRDALEAATSSELGSVAALDGVVERRGAPAAWARGVDRVVVVSSDTTVGVAIAPAVFALCAKCDVVVKDRSDALVAAFFSSLAQEHPAFAHAAQARAWHGGDDPDEDELLARADTVVAFGRDETLRTIRARCGVDARFIPFGHRASIGRLTRAEAEQLDDALAERIARDALLYDGEGCLSLHALFVHSDAARHGAASAGDETLAHVARVLAGACERVAVEFPGGSRAPGRAAQVGAYRSLATFRAAGGRGGVLRGGDATLVVDPPRDEPPPFLPRVLPLIAVPSDDAVAAYAAEQRLPVQALGVVAPDARAAALAERIGAVRVAPFGAMQDPPVAGHHGGAPRIAHFVRWIDRE
ncbi:MAG: acyl-CoA reductase [Candidatus Eremiobacteraeota bacterium]|nr:acyl-CoA reductase [Candidatus Eremiobacteraeota bacterium]